MTKTKIAIYIALIFLAGGVAGAGIATALRPASMPPPHGRGPGGDRPPEDFQTHLFNRLKEKLGLTPEQIAQVEPVFRKGFEEVRAIQDRGIKEVEAAVKKNHDEIARLITPEQAQKLEEMDRERQKAFRERHNRHHGPGPGPDGPPPPGWRPESKDSSKSGEKTP